MLEITLQLLPPQSKYFLPAVVVQYVGVERNVQSYVLQVDALFTVVVPVSFSKS
jgi:hypothetical protein